MNQTERDLSRWERLKRWTQSHSPLASIALFLALALLIAWLTPKIANSILRHDSATSAVTSPARETPSTKAPQNPQAYTSTRIVYAQPVTIGDTGIRCYVGNASTACVSTRTPVDSNGREHRWSAVLSVQRPGITENGFEPGSQVPGSQMTVGDLVGYAGTIGYISALGDRDATVRVADREVSYREMFSTTDSFEGLFRPNPDNMALKLKNGADTDIHGWYLSLDANTLTVKAASNTWTLSI